MGREELLEQVLHGWAGFLWARGRAALGPYLPGVLQPLVDHLELQA